MNMSRRWQGPLAGATIMVVALGVLTQIAAAAETGRMLSPWACLCNSAQATRACLLATARAQSNGRNNGRQRLLTT